MEALQARYGRDVPLSFNTYLCRDDDDHPTHYGNPQVDDYGNPLKQVAVEQLLALAPMGLYRLDRVPAILSDSWLAFPALTYLSHLPDGWRVALFWH